MRAFGLLMSHWFQLFTNVVIYLTNCKAFVGSKNERHETEETAFIFVSRKFVGNFCAKARIIGYSFIQGVSVRVTEAIAIGR